MREDEVMTEEEWLACEDPNTLLRFLQGMACERKLRLFAISAILPYAAARGNHRAHEILEVAEQAAEDQLNRSELRSERMAVGAWSLPAIPYSPTELAIRAAGLCLDAHPQNAAVAVMAAAAHLEAFLGSGTPTPPDKSDSASTAASMHNRTQLQSDCRRRLALQLRDVIGNPFRSVGIERRWRTETAVLLARQTYESRDFGAMPILADALQDAGCEDEQLLSHCRDANQVHVRGCWVVDLVLGKE